MQDEQVVEFLKHHPDFLQKHPEVLDHLVLHHEAGEGAVSLMERQIKVLRERQSANREKLAEWVRVGRENDAIAERMHHFTLALMQAHDEMDLITRILASLRSDFDIVSVRLLIDAEARSSIETLLPAARTRCGHFALEQRRAVFGDEAESIASMALVPIGPAASLGALALGSIDADRFTPAMSTDFLARMGELLGAALLRCRMQAA
ncbi:MAG: DUF484 family protein [Steroidobacteraceae bacterium]